MVTILTPATFAYCVGVYKIFEQCQIRKHRDMKCGAKVVDTVRKVPPSPDHLVGLAA